MFDSKIIKELASLNLCDLELKIISHIYEQDIKYTDILLTFHYDKDDINLALYHMENIGLIKATVHQNNTTHFSLNHTWAILYTPYDYLS